VGKGKWFERIDPYCKKIVSSDRVGVSEWGWAVRELLVRVITYSAKRGHVGWVLGQKFANPRKTTGHRQGVVKFGRGAVRLGVWLKF